MKHSPCSCQLLSGKEYKDYRKDVHVLKFQIVFLFHNKKTISNWVIYHVLWVIKTTIISFIVTTKPAFDYFRGTYFIYVWCSMILVMALIFLSFKIEVHIRIAVYRHFSELFIIAIRLHFQLSGGCLVHLQTKWAASLHYTVASAFILGFYLCILAVIKTPFVTVMRLNSHTKGQLWDLNAPKKQPKYCPVLFPRVQHHTDMPNPL